MALTDAGADDASIFHRAQGVLAEGFFAADVAPHLEVGGSNDGSVRRLNGDDDSALRLNGGMVGAGMSGNTVREDNWLLFSSPRKYS